MTNREERARKRAIRRRREERAERIVQCIRYAVDTVLIMAVMLLVAIGLTGVLFQNVQCTIEITVAILTWAVGMWLFMWVFEKEEKRKVIKWREKASSFIAPFTRRLKDNRKEYKP